MPELPEVENVVRTIAPYLMGRTIVRAEFGSPWVTPGDRELLARQVMSRRVTGVRRHGKFILVDLDQGSLTIHLGMTGKLLAGAARTPYTHGFFELDGDAVVVYDDVRQFGSIEYSAGVNPRVAALGPDALTVTAEEFVSKLRSRTTRLKPLLLNQAFVAGLGNIYVDEVLFRAKLHPLQIASRVRMERARELHGLMQRVLQESIAAGGSSISDYVDGEGRKGAFQERHRVYGREGKPCPDCTAAIVRTVVAQRGTHLCPACQRRR
ncbi:formamidopyrimidine-DNA glycosylase [Bryobacterales bacterium F-183]|nr:formamidopyrimidine-DNA glycosylase [Bryobacterales bacterium F-183]